jgi:DNA-binding LacI/PurR family transcriptional regulator
VGKHIESDAEFPGTLDLLDPAVLPRLRGVFSFHSLYELGPKIERAGVPLVYVGNPHGKHSVALDTQDGFVREALQHLRGVGCRSVGLIGHSLPANSRIGEVFAREAAACGLKCDRGWIEQVRMQPTERIGYESFMRLWANSRRPEGVLVQDDVMCNGVLRATLQLDVDLPRDLRLITLANRDMELAYHLPVTRMEMDPDELARRAVEMMMALAVEGRAVEPRVLLRGRLIKGETT